MEGLVRIDGSQGEGGGQILRTALAMGAVYGRPVEIFNVRAGRATPGLRPQHVACLRAAAEICGAEVEGDAVGSLRVVFRPGRIRPGVYRFEVGTAGSVTLVTQTVLPILLSADGASTVTIVGGTHVPLSPTWDYFAETFLPQLRRMGAEVDARIVRFGFSPAGGGEVVLDVKPWTAAVRYELLERGKLRQVQAVARVANLPLDIAESEIKTISRYYTIRRDYRDPELKTLVETVDSAGPGNVCILRYTYENVAVVFSRVGARGKSRKEVADGVCWDAGFYLWNGGAADLYLSDQLLLPLFLAADRLPEGETCWGRFTMPMRHSLYYRNDTDWLHFDTNWNVLKMFRGDCEMREIIDASRNFAVEVQIGRKGFWK